MSNVNEELNRKMKMLTQDWDSYIRFNPPRQRRCSTNVKSTVKIARLYESSPINLTVPSSQRRKQPQAKEWKVRNNDLAMLEILGERRAAMESGELKGRRLLEALDGASDISMTGGKQEIICSTCSSVLIQNSEVRSWYSSNASSSSSYDGDDDGGSGEDAGNDFVCDSCYSSSSSCAEKVETGDVGADQKEKAVMENRSIGLDNAGKRRMQLAWLPVVLVVFAICIVSHWSLHKVGDEDVEILFPT